jgi:alpha-amylase
VSERLRYAIPFKLPQETRGILYGLATGDGNSAAILLDDGEKFGLWPGTRKWVFEEKWLFNFFSMLKAEQSWVKTETFGSYLKAHKPKGRIYLPTASYKEMMEWVLFPDSFKEYERARNTLSSAGTPHWENFLKGGFWRNYLVKYEEINRVHKKMLQVSRAIEEALAKGPDGAKAVLLKKAQNELYQGQCNCAYWHGLFGGMYLNHLKSALWEHLLRAEAFLDDAVRGRSEFLQVEEADYDQDGEVEVLVRQKSMDLYFKPAAGGALFEWDIKGKGINLASTVTRRRESYHEKLIQFVESGGQGSGHAVASIHDLVRVKEPGLEKRLFTDWYPKDSLLDHFLGAAVTLDEFRQCRYTEEGDFVNQPYTAQVKKTKTGASVILARDGGIFRDGRKTDCRVVKEIVFPAGKMEFTALYTVTNTGEREMDYRFGVEFDWNFLAGAADDRQFILPGRAVAQPHLDAEGAETEVSRAGIRDAALGLELLMGLSRPAELWRFPIETITQSDNGFERGYQSTVLMPLWTFRLQPGASWEAAITHALTDLKRGTHAA